MVEDVVKALTNLAETSRKERVAIKSYVGTDWNGEGHKFIQARLQARQDFEGALERFVVLLTSA